MVIDVLLLLALPAAGKSELRRYLEYLDPATATADLHLRPTIQLDDYPYVHMMRRISEELRVRDSSPVFFRSGAGSFLDPRDWATLTQLINLDFADLTEEIELPSGSAASWLLGRIDQARRAAGIDSGLGIDEAALPEIRSAIESEAASLLAAKPHAAATELAGKTIVIELARGGPAGSPLPLDPPHGYQHAFRQFSDEILSRAAILYVWVTPDESARRNLARSIPGREGDASILHHGVPPDVMRNDYGTDDLMWLLARGGGTVILVDKSGRRFAVPTAVFDNREDLTSFLRDDPTEWSPVKLSRLHRELATACAGIGPAQDGKPNITT